MPISAANMKLYPGGSIRSPEWRAIVERIKNRSGNKCEQCAAPNGKIICRGDGIHAGTYMLEKGDVFDADTGARLGIARGSEYPGEYVKIVLTTAHLDNDPTHNDDSNLAHLCQRCHNRHDAPHWRRNAARTRRARYAVADLFGKVNAQS